MYVNGCTLQRITTIFFRGPKQTQNIIVISCIHDTVFGQCIEISSFIRCCCSNKRNRSIHRAARETRDDAHNLDNSIKVNMEKVFSVVKIWQKITHLLVSLSSLEKKGNFESLLLKAEQQNDDSIKMARRKPIKNRFQFKADTLLWNKTHVSIEIKWTFCEKMILSCYVLAWILGN